MSKKHKDFFWMSFSDLMTSLFFVVLVLYVLTYVMLKEALDTANTTIEEQDKILQLKEQFKPLQEDKDFIYLQDCKKYISKELNSIEIFEPNKSTILEKYKLPTIKVGNKLEDLLKDLNKANAEFSYLVIIEGNMANTWDKKFNTDSDYGYKKSYERALAVYNLWNNNNIDLRKYNSEILISGSGFNGLCRDEVEDNNKRFSIQIIPKIEYSK
jgi:outer membrane protein OmpA-like peptidoglycan-associated protein